MCIFSFLFLSISLLLFIGNALQQTPNACKKKRGCRMKTAPFYVDHRSLIVCRMELKTLIRHDERLTTNEKLLISRNHA